MASLDSIEDFLLANGFDALDCGGSFGGSDLVVRGSQEILFRARELVLRDVKTRRWKLSWFADVICVQDSWDQLGWEKGPWIRIAEVRHRMTPTLHVLGRLQAHGMPTYFYFGEEADFVFVHCKDAAKAGKLLRENPFSGVVVHDGR